MKTMITVLIFLVSGWSALLFSAQNNQKAKTFSYTALIECSDIEAKSYFGNHSNGSFQVTMRIKDGRYFRKNFHSPSALQQASYFIKDLEKCRTIALESIPASPATFDVAQFEIFF